MDTKQLTCKERLPAHKRQAIREMKIALGKIKVSKKEAEEIGLNDSRRDNDPLGWYTENALAFDTNETLTRGMPLPHWFNKNEYDDYAEIEEGALNQLGYTIGHIQLSWGGPADGFVFVAEKRRNGISIERAYYYFQDWNDGAVSPLTGNNYDLFQELIESLGIFEY